MKVSDSKIQEWLKAGIIGQQQATQILNYEVNNNKNWVVTGFMILAAAVIGLGCISLVAYNWELIPNVVKLSADFAILTVIAIAAVYFWQSKPIVFDILSLIFIILCLASIGLIAQIYNLSAPPYRALLLWSAMTLLIVSYSQRTFTWWLWLGIVIAASYSWFADKLHIVDNGVTIILTMFYVFVAALLYSKHCISNISFHKAARIWLVTLMLLSLVFIELFGNFRLITSINTNININYLPCATYILAMLALIMSRPYSAIQRGLGLCVITLLLLQYLFLLSNINFLFMHAILTGLTLVSCAILAVTFGYRGLFNFFIMLLGLRALIFYWEALGGMATSGLSLIILGVAILYCTFLWRRHGTQLVQSIERWTNAAK